MLDQLNTQPALIDQVHDRLVEAIASGDLAPGLRLTQESVAEMLGVSRQPVSHALQVLKRRGLLIEHGKRGLAVAPLERARIGDLYQVREVLDGLAARLAAARCRSGSASKTEREELAAALAQGRDLAEEAGISRMVAADVAFHTALHRLSGNPEIAATVAEQWPQFMRSMGFVLSAGGRFERIWREHGKIADAVLGGDAAAAERHARAHTTKARKEALTELPAEVAA